MGIQDFTVTTKKGKSIMVCATAPTRDAAQTAVRTYVAETFPGVDGKEEGYLVGMFGGAVVTGHGYEFKAWLPS